MMTIRKALLLFAAVALVASGIGVLADGTEQLGPPSVAIQSGTGMVSAGTGMNSQPGILHDEFNASGFEVPAGATVKQVLLYWEGFTAEDGQPGDDTVTVTKGAVSTSVTGTLIGGPTLFFGGATASVYRADITDLGLVTPGLNSISVSDMGFTFANNGAGIIVIFDDGSTSTVLDIRDGSDLAFGGFAPPLDTTVGQTFTFPASTSDRTGQLHMFFASVAGTLSGFGLRPTAIEITTNGPNGSTQVRNNVLDSVSGEEFDNFVISFDIPSGATSVTVRAFSEDRLGIGGLPASFDWLAAGFAIEPETPPGLPGRMTGGGSVFTVDGVRVTRGFQIHCDLREPNNLEVNWGNGQKFHLTELTGAICTDTPAVEEPPSAPFDTFDGEGVGKLNNKPGATIFFTFVDKGEPGDEDTALIRIFDPSGNQVLEVSGLVDRGNVQAHKDNQSLLN
jgi:hypothetical protein